jgi:hypothetical protein
MRNWLKISHHQHSGRLRPHEHTSYVPLAILMVVVGLLLAVCSVSALPDPPPQEGSVGLTGTVPKPAPKVAATILSPNRQQHFSTSPVTVSGTCPAGTLVEIYKNDIFAGSSPCDDKGSFSLEIDLLIGQNVLIARVYDVLNQTGPDSNSVTVFYDALPSQAASLSSLNFGGTQLLLNTDAVYRGVFPDQMLNIPINIIGGIPPYAVNVEWGDSSNKVVPRNDNLTFNAGHVFKKPGTYKIGLQASDAQGRVAFLNVAAIVNGQPSAVAATALKGPVNKLLVLWPVYVSAITLVFSFWLGERREKRILQTSAPAY